MTYDIAQRKAQLQADAALYKSLSGTEATELYNTDRTTYSRLVAAAGVLPYQGPGLRIAHPVTSEKQDPTDREIALLVKYDAETIDRFYSKNGDTKNPDSRFILAKKLSQEDGNINGFVPRPPAEIQEIRNAAILRGKLAGECRWPTDAAPVTQTSDDGRVNAGVNVIGLDPNTRVSTKQFLDLQEAAAKKLAARSTDQIARDRATELRRESDRVFASLAPVKS